MKIQKNIIRLFATGMLTGGLAACDSTSCPINNVVYSSYGFYVMENGTETPISILDTLTVTAGGSDSILVNRLQNGGQVELPVSYTSATDTLVFSFINEEQQERRDTIWIDKENIPHYESPDCPVSFFHHVTAVRYTQVLIDSVSIVNPNINYNVSENFKIYFHSGN